MTNYIDVYSIYVNNARHNLNTSILHKGAAMECVLLGNQHTNNSENLTSEDLPNCSFEDYGLLCRRTLTGGYVCNLDNPLRMRVGWGNGTRSSINLSYLALSKVLESNTDPDRIWQIAKQFTADIITSMPSEGGRIPISEIIYWLEYNEFA